MRLYTGNRRDKKLSRFFVWIYCGNRKLVYLCGVNHRFPAVPGLRGVGGDAGLCGHLNLNVMTIHRIAHCKVIKGNGPAFVDKIVEVFIDDVDPGICESEILYMVMADIRYQLSGFSHFTIGDIFSA